MATHGCILRRELRKIKKEWYFPKDQGTNVKCINMAIVKCATKNPIIIDAQTWSKQFFKCAPQLVQVHGKICFCGFRCISVYVECRLFTKKAKRFFTATAIWTIPDWLSDFVNSAGGHEREVREPLLATSARCLTVALYSLITRQQSFGKEKTIKTMTL